MTNADWDGAQQVRPKADEEPHSNRAPGSEELCSLLAVIADQIADTDRRHTEVLAEMRDRLTVLGDDTRSVRTQVTGDLGPVLTRIEDALSDLAARIDDPRIDAHSEGRSVGHAAEPPQPEHDHAPAVLRLGTPAPVFLSPGTEPPRQAAQPAVDTFDVFDSSLQAGGGTPWDAEQAEALTRIYEEDRAAAEREAELAASAPPPADHAPRYDAAEVDASFAPPPAANPDDRDWLESKFAEIAVRIEQSLAAMSPAGPLEGLGERFDLFERRFGAALHDVATRADVESLRHIEGQIGELAGHIEQAQTQLARLDAIEHQISAVIEHVADQRLGAAPAAGIDAQEIERIVELTADHVVHRIAETIPAPAAGRAGDEMRHLLEAFIAEQRFGDEQTMSMLDTLQQALIRILDRVDAIEAVQQSTPHPHYQPHAASEEASHSYADAGFAIEDANHGLTGYASPPASASYSPPGLTVQAAAFNARQDETLHEGGDEGHEPGVGIPVPALDEYEPEYDLETYAEDESEAPVGAGAALPTVPPPIPTLPPQTAQEHETDSPTIAFNGKSPIEKLRQDFIADAQRAKLKAAAAQSASGAAADPAPAHPAAGRKWSLPSKDATDGTRIFGLSPRIIVIALAAIVALNGAMLLFSGGSKPTVEGTPPAAGAPASPSTDPSHLTPGQLEQRSEGGSGYGDAFGGSLGFMTDADGDASAAAGLRVQVSDVPSEEDFLRLKHQQRMARMSGDVGANAVTYMTPAAYLTEDLTAMIAPAAPATGSVAANGGASATHLDLPPATVGPLSLRLAAAKGDPSAQFEVGARLAEGKGTAQNFTEALRWYQRAAAQGFAQAQYRLGTLYERGLGAKPDAGRARDWYQRAAEQGNVKAMHNLAVLAAGNTKGAPDYHTAATWFRTAAEHGLQDSQYNLGVLYESGLGVEKDMKEAYKWYALAARSGDKDASRRRDAALDELAPADRGPAEELVASFAPATTDSLANDARAAGEDWKKRQVAGDVEPGQ